ncbi:hypothetical protein cyc_07523 [Cyclospora cayetanensis]|uniref:Exoribonuclease phosphorolytic domain-containing protein n=1 Tax=Cyclospora cayetanensis TaxID=88456 RepID=A0A1D3CZC9_9EIME|nr:hypothetical protein cyc_07523 [Cyclospora cayetanensis]
MADSPRKLDPCVRHLGEARALPNDPHGVFCTLGHLRYPLLFTVCGLAKGLRVKEGGCRLRSVQCMPPPLCLLRCRRSDAVPWQRLRLGLRLTWEYKSLLRHVRLPRAPGAPFPRLCPAGPRVVHAQREVVGVHACMRSFGPRSAGRSDLQDRGFIKVDYRGSPFFNKKAEDGVRGGLQWSSLPLGESSGSTEQSAMLLHQALDSAVQLQRYPKSIIEVCVMVLEDDGGALPAAITCAGLALADAGVELYDLVTGASAYAFSYKDESGATRQAICLDLDASVSTSWRAAEAGAEEGPPFFVSRDIPNLCAGTLCPQEYAAYKDYPDFTAIHFGFCPALSSICCLQCRGPLIGGTSGEQVGLWSCCIPRWLAPKLRGLEDGGRTRLRGGFVFLARSALHAVDAPFLCMRPPHSPQLFSLCEAVCTAIGMEVRRCLQSAFAIKEQKTILDVSQKRATAEGSASP